MRQPLIGVFCLLVAAPALPAEAPRAKEILRQIETEGPRPVLGRLWGDQSRFNQVCERITSGDAAWLEVARRLRDVSDAGPSMALTDCVARALPHAPERVLRLIGHSGFGMENLCTSPFIEPEPRVAERYRRQALAALRTPLPSDLEAVRNECIRRIAGKSGA